MRHVDEGTLHELIDGSLPPFERQRVEDHLRGCAECRARLAEARALVVETAELVEALDAEPSPGRAIAQRASAPPARARRIPPPSYLAWAASIVLAVGAGVEFRGWLHPLTPAAVVIAPAPTDLVAPKPPAPVTHDARPATSSPATEPRVRRPVMAPPTMTRGEAVPASGAMNATGLAGADLPAVAKARASYPAPLPAKLVEPDRALALDRVDTGDQPATRHRITLEEAVARLGGTIRLIDGLQPVAVERITGISMPGEHPDSDAVLVRYMDPQFGAVELTQQRAPDQDPASPPATELKPTGPLPAHRGQVVALPRALAAAATPPTTSISWQDAQGFHLTLTAAAPVEALTALRDRVR